MRTREYGFRPSFPSRFPADLALLQNTPREPPSKFVTSTAEVQLACRLLFVDLEGLNDGRAVKTIVPQIHPRKMVSFSSPSCG